MEKCFCGHKKSQHGKYINGGKNEKGSRYYCQVQGCCRWSYCDIKRSYNSKMKKYKPVRRKRSHLCPDKICKMVWTNYKKDEFDEGYSHSCYGVLGKKYSIKAKQGAEHDNEGSHCQYTPFKGMIRFFVTLNDLFLENLGTLYLMDRLDPRGKCCKCKQEIRRHMVSSIVIGKNKKDKWCNDCYRKR